MARDQDRRNQPDLGDDDQQFETDLRREYEDDPPRDRVISDEDRGEIGISSWVRRETRSGERDDDERCAEEAAVHVEAREHRPRPEEDGQAG